MSNNYTKVTEGVFNAAKLMLKGGAVQREVCEYLNLSRRTVGIISASETYAEYKNNMYCTTAAYRAQEMAKKAEAEKSAQPAQVVEHKTSVTVQATHYVETKIDKINEQLTLLNNKLGFIVDELAGVKK